GLINYVVVFVITATFAALTYLPSTELTFILFPEASNSVNTWFFPQRMTNTVAVWAVISGGFSIIVFLITQYNSYFINKNVKKLDVSHQSMIESWGIKVSFVTFLKTVLVSLLTVTAYFTLLMLVNWIFKVDFRLIFIMAARPLNGKVLIQILMYFPLDRKSTR